MAATSIRPIGGARHSLAEMAALAAYRRRNGWGDPVEAETRYDEAEMASLLGWSKEAQAAFLRRMEA